MSEQPPPEHRRRVRSFVRRPGRLTPAQARALESLLPRYRIDDSVGDLREAFQRPAPLVVELGFGNGEALAAMAAAEPQFNFVGIEVHEPGVGRLLMSLEHDHLDNVRVAMRDGVEVLRGQAIAESLAQLRIYFPDPWPKKRHHKRRLIQPEFAAMAASRLEPGGLLHLATDWVPYAEWMLEVLEAEPALVNRGDPWVSRPAWRPQTHFERRGLGKGHEVRDLVFERAEGAIAPRME